MSLIEEDQFNHSVDTNISSLPSQDGVFSKR